MDDQPSWGISTLLPCVPPFYPLLQRILRELKLPKINQLLIHWPTAFKKTDGEALWPKDKDGKHLYDLDCPPITEVSVGCGGMGKPFT